MVCWHELRTWPRPVDWKGIHWKSPIEINSTFLFALVLYRFVSPHKVGSGTSWSPSSETRAQIKLSFLRFSQVQIDTVNLRNGILVWKWCGVHQGGKDQWWKSWDSDTKEWFSIRKDVIVGQRHLGTSVTIWWNSCSPVSHHCNQRTESYRKLFKSSEQLGELCKTHSTDRARL